MIHRVEILKAQINQLGLPELNLWLANHPNEVPPYLKEQLNDFRDALPIISALKENGVNELIPILNSADDKILIAFARLTKGSDLNVLVETFLVKNSNDLDLVNRNRLIQFLRQPNLAAWLTQYLQSLEEQSGISMSLRFSMLLLESRTNEIDHISQLHTFLTDYPFPVALKVLLVLVDFYNDELKEDLFSPVSCAFILLIYDVLNRMNLSSQIEFINGLNQKALLLIIDFCLQGAAGDNLEHQQICNTLLLLLISHTKEVDTQCQVLMKARQLHSYLFNTPPLQELAKEILTENQTLPTSFDATWLERLMTSARFIAASNPKVLKQLSDRYKLNFLYQSDSQLTLYLNDQNPLYEPISDGFIRINKAMLLHPEAKEALLAKKLRLIKFTIDAGLDSLLYQFEEDCEHNAEDKALAVLYSYYRATFPSLRADLFFRAVDYAYKEAREKETDIATGQSVLLSWFKQFVPNQTFDQKNLQRKNGVWLYNSEGQKIASLNEANEAIAFVDEEPILLIKTGAVQIDEPIYDENKTVIGYLTKTGQLRSAGLFQKNTSAHLLALVPEKELEQSSQGLELLVHNVLFENSIEELYSSCTSDSKRSWLEKQLSKAVRVLKTELCPSTRSSLVAHFNDDALFFLLGNIQHETNAFNFFHDILNQDKTREVLFSGLHESDVHQFLKNHDVVSCFAHYLANFYDKPWFSKGLLKFAQFAKKYKKEQLLSEALALLNAQASNDSTQMTQFDSIIMNLISSEECAVIVLKDLLNERSQGPVQHVIDPEINKVTQYFQKRHIVAALQKLNKTSYWETSAQYRLMLHVLNNQHDKLFSTNAASQAWQSDELIELGTFINRHLGKKRIFDNQSVIGHKLLGELIFTSAQLGQTSLFYTNRTLNSKTARLFFTHSFLEQLVDKFWTPEGIKEQCTDDVARIKMCFNELSPLQKELNHHQSFLDWRHLVNQTWNEVGKKKLPAICAFILNYTGHKKPLAFLLHHYFQTYQKEADYIHPITHLLQEFPQRDFSAVLFDTLEATLIKNPQILDKTVLRDMAHYYAKKVMNKEASSAEAELDLLIYFGQNKHYSIVQKGCDELINNCEDKPLRDRLIKGAEEAKVEMDLSASLGRFYFGLVKTFKRLWYYGFSPEKKSSKIVKFCDDDSITPKRKHAENSVKIPAFNEGSNTPLSFKEKRKQFISLLATIKRSPMRPETTTRISSASQALFYKGSESRRIGKVDSVASNKTVGHHH